MDETEQRRDHRQSSALSLRRVYYPTLNGAEAL
jgi:hypothetical protein